jgi:protein-S-isoprenylcysteine O-methyltransferase Ste14
MLTLRRSLVAMPAAAVMAAPGMLRPERLLHPSVWLLVLSTWAVYATQPAPTGKLWGDAVDRRSALFIVIATAAANLVGISDFVRRETMTPDPLSWTMLAGTGLVATGIGVRLWAIRTLGRHFTALVEAPTGGVLVETGPYARVRHPSYTGVLIALCGMAVVFASVAAAAVLFALVLPAYAYRIRLEEAEMTRSLGARYREYRQKTGALLPRTSQWGA